MKLARISRRLAPLALAVALAACSSGGGGGGAGQVGVPGSDPVTTVNSLVATLQAKAFDKLPALACAASKDSVSQFDPTSGLSSALNGVSAADILAAINVTMSNVTVGSPSVTGDTAKVHVKGDLKVSADQSKIKDLIKKYLQAAGQPADDTMVNAAVSAMGTAFEQTQTIDNDVTLKNEGGKWLICQ